MDKISTISTNPATYYRLIALWVVCEALLGGIIHGFRIPVSGLIVGSSAVICICLIGWYVPARGAIIKATIIVAIFKMMLSPQAPPPAYIAVFFQGLLGELLFRNRKYFRLCCILLATLALLESGLQRILVLTIVYGNDLWTAINDFLNKLTRQKGSTNYSMWIGIVYVAIHFITGLVVGWWAAVLPGKIAVWRKDKNIAVVANDNDDVLSVAKTKKKRIKAGLFIIWLLLLALYVQSYFKIGAPLLPSHISLKIFLRSLIIILAWIFILGPALRKLLRGWLEKKKNQSQQEVAEVLRLLPATQAILKGSWKSTAMLKGFKRLKLFIKTALVNALAPIDQGSIYILSAPIGSGKTTSLLNWIPAQNNVFGILTPVINGKRIFADAHTGERFQMEAGEGETEILEIGRFVFSKKSFVKAESIIRHAIGQPGWLIIDEVGPLEIKGEGFYTVLKEVLSKRDKLVVLVVREGLVEDVKKKFGIEPVVIHDIQVLRKTSDE